MEVILAKTAGFCFGVKRAVDMVYEQIGAEEPIYTYGPIIHNEEVVGDLKDKGVEILESAEDLRQVTKGSVVIRSHGVSEAIYRMIEEQGLRLVDATCPFVKRIHEIVSEASENGDLICIIGNDHHPEVEGIKGWCKSEPVVIENAEDIEKKNLPLNRKITVVSQTTFNSKKFQDLVEILNKKGYDISACSTICNATEVRQKEAADIASRADAMVVIGGKTSSNTQKLYEICKQHCENTYYIQTLQDLDLTAMTSVNKVGITAGASTPNNIIKEVQSACQK